MANSFVLFNKITIIAIAIVLSAWLTPFANSLNAKNVHFEVLNTRNLEGSLGTVGSIIQDKNGFIWFGSDRGLIRFDGHRFRTYVSTGKSNDIPGTIILDLMLDTDEQLWIATSQGLSRYREKTDDFESLYYNEKIQTTHLSSIAWGAPEHILAGTYHGLHIINQTTGDIRVFRTNPNDPSTISANEVNDIFIDTTNNIAWISTQNGVTELNLETLVFTRHLAGQQLNIHRTIKDSKGNMWFGVFDGGLIKQSPQKQQTHFKYSAEDESTIASNDIHSIMEDSRGNIWVATDHGGLNLYSEASNNFIRFQEDRSIEGSINSNQVRNIFEDRNNNLWISTFSDGINLFNLKNTGIKNYNHNPDDPTSISHDGILFLHKLNNKKILVGTEAGVDIFDPQTELFKPFPDRDIARKKLNKHPVLAITEDKNKDLWFGTWSGGAYRYSPSTGLVKKYYPDTNDISSLGSAYVWSLLSDSKGQLWFGTETNGLNKYNSTTDSFERYPALNLGKAANIKWAFVTDTIEDNSGILWISTYVGLFLLDSNTMEFQLFKAGPGGENKLSSRRATALLERKNGDIWVATQDAGINIIEKNTRNVRHFGRKSGIPSLNIAGMIEDDTGVIWVTTADGLIKVIESPLDDPNDQSTLKVFKVKLRGNLVDNKFNRNAVLDDDNGNLYFGGINGLSIVNLNTISGSDAHSNLAFSDFYINHERILPNENDSPLKNPIQNTEKIVLDFQDNSFLIQFSALNYASNSLTKYAYRLVGFNDKWRETTDPFANYTSMNPGNYTFEVKSENTSGVWGDQNILKLDIKIKPLIWLTWWAYCIYIAIISLLLYFLFTYFRLRINSEMYRELAARDPLTGIYNRQGFVRVTNKNFCDNKARENMWFLLVDIDHFKKINDEYGHDIGDQALSSVVNSIKDCIRNTDNIFRWGGEEFLVIVETTDSESAYTVAEKIRKNISKEKYIFGSIQLNITISTGVAKHKENESFEDLFKRADLALYQAKGTGRNKTEIYTENLKQITQQSGAA